VSEGRLICVPLAFAELLHATLGPLGDVLQEQDHAWAPMVKRVLAEYTSRRDTLLVDLHGEEILSAVDHTTFVAVEEIHAVTEHAIAEEEDFTRWTSEVGQPD
jgi:hypothetical protein